MTNLAISAVLLLSSLALLLFLKRKKQLAFPIVLITSTAYYALGGFWYWTSEADGFFVGLDWSTGLPFAVLLFCGATFLATFSYFLLLSSSKGRVSPLPINQDVLVFQNRRFLTVHLIGLISSAFVILTNSSRGPAFLIAYQFSDLLIATSLIAFALQPRSPYTVASLIYFIGYSVFVGFRYKLAIIAIPIMLVFYIANRGFKRWIYFFTLPSFVILAFSVITFTRVKFSGLNFDAVSEVDSTRLLYGLFAETNLLFGVVSIIDYVLPTYPPTYFGSAIDAVLELIPRALFPDRQTGDHMFYVLEGLQTQEGFNSGTAYPFFGEFLMAFGYPGYFLGCLAFGSIVARLVVVAERIPSKRLSWTAIGLLAALFGYYYVSRGYFPQFAKSLLFVLLPFFYLSRDLHRKNSK